MKLEEQLLTFIRKSPSAFNVVENVKKELTNNGFNELHENNKFEVKKGESYFVSRNNTSIIAFKIPENLDEKYSFNIVASHSDSPCFKLKPICDMKQDSYNKVSVEPYGGMICSSWLDRPLSIAGRVLIFKNDILETKIIDIEKPVLLIPNLCIHFNRDVNTGHNYNMSTDMQPFLGENIDGKPVYSLVANHLGVKEEDIKGFDLFAYPAEDGVIWGINNEYISSPRLDDLECVFASLKALIDSKNSNVINVMIVCDNEEVGSKTRQGADSNFMLTTLKRLNHALTFDDDNFFCAVNSSMLISADNAHAVHPNFLGITDSLNKVYMNKGIVIKSNASQSYTTDSLSSSITQLLCEKAKVPFQFFTNKSDIRGGSTLGNISNSQLSIMSVDIGLPQLAMHSSYETAGVKDLYYLVDLLRKFYSCKLTDIYDGK